MKSTSLRSRRRPINVLRRQNPLNGIPVTAREKRKAETKESLSPRREECVYITLSLFAYLLTIRSRNQRRNAAMEYYDTSDPFIDDSELPMDERTFFAQTKQQGFYVSSGEVALLKDKYVTMVLTPSQAHGADLLHRPTRKPKSKKVNLLSPAGVLATVGSTSNTKDVSNGTEDDDKKRKSVEDHSEAVKKRRTDVRPFHPELEQMIESLKAAIANGKYNPVTSSRIVLTRSPESWVKGKFPPTLKPTLAQVALKAVVLGEYDDNFFNLMPKIFPYNRYTLSVNDSSQIYLYPLTTFPETYQTPNLERPYYHSYGTAKRTTR